MGVARFAFVFGGLPDDEMPLAEGVALHTLL
ncbi:protein of unknown function [Pseudomonas marincola]|uniref:Uncharacterized protein n=1 Tax=Pseudomonas marincola TaxID=437900 RepID=A0A8S2BEM2_9PSED|nr:protein of unknown function [Pseudomonas marincola]